MRRMELELPSGELRLIAEERRGAMDQLGERLREIGSGMSSIPKSLEQELERRLDQVENRGKPFGEAIDSASMARAFLVAYRSRPGLRSNIAFTSDVMNTLANCLGNRTAPLVSVYLEYFDLLDARIELGTYLNKHYASIDRSRAVAPAEERLCRFSSTLFDENGPEIFADNATRAEGGVASLSQQAGLPTIGEFHDLVWRHYYVAQARAAPMGEITDALREAYQAGIHEQPLQGLLVGHLLVKVLVERCITENQAIPDQWLSFLLRVAGDPRKPSTALGFQKWWAPQQKEVVSKVKASLAKRDLNFFLELLEEFASQAGGDIERMYPARRRFLEGFLAEGDSVQDALLILSKSGRAYIREKLSAEERKEFTCSNLRGGIEDQCAIYLELPNGHVIEGSHQSMLRFYRSDASFPCDLRDRRPVEVEYRSITGSDTAFEKRHHPPVSWQFHTMKHIAESDYGIRLNPEKALISSDYRKMLQDYGTV